MSNRKKLPKQMKAFDGLTQGYEERIARQREALDRMVAAHTLATAALHGINTDVTNVKDARKLASQALAQIKDILAVPKEEESND